MLAFKTHLLLIVGLLAWCGLTHAVKPKTSPSSSSSSDSFTWHVTTPIDEGGIPSFRTETIRDHLERIRTERNGDMTGLDFPETSDVNASLMTPRLEKHYRDWGFSDQGIEDIKHNSLQNRRAYQFLQSGGTVRYPNAIHHPTTVQPNVATRTPDPSKLAYVYVGETSEAGRPKRILSFQPHQ